MVGPDREIFVFRGKKLSRSTHFGTFRGKKLSRSNDFSGKMFSWIVFFREFRTNKPILGHFAGRNFHGWPIFENLGEESFAEREKKKHAKPRKFLSLKYSKCIGGGIFHELLTISGAEFPNNIYYFLIEKKIY